MSNKYVKTVNFDMFSEYEKNIMNENKAEINKIMSKVLKNSRNASKLDSCYYCGNKCDGFCNSHSVPSFCLKNIAENGRVLTLGEFLDIPIINKEKGVNQAGTFHIICRDCDSKIFSDYENPNNYNSFPTQKMLAQISLKNNLKFISKRLLEKEMYNNMFENLNLPDSINSANQYVKDLDLNEFIQGFNKAKKILDKNLNDGYYICFYKKLNYVVPLAFQSSVFLLYDLEDNIINNIYNPSPNYVLKPLNICVFPLENETVIMIFVDNKDKRHRKFYRQFNKLSLEEQLLTLTFIMIAYTEDIFFSGKLPQDIKTDPYLIKTSQANSSVISMTPSFNPHEGAREEFSLSNRKNIPNLLSEEYKLR